MTEQEKQAIRDDLHGLFHYTDEHLVILQLLDALDERDREVEVWKKHANDFKEMFKQEHKEKNALKREIYRLRKSLEEIANVTPWKSFSEIRELARKALAGEEG
ncbi:MAG TPA: hypothetical protein VJ824_13020 [Bacillota bacterium]|nr:hypothetical protein [Bacillota bacterium]